MTTNRAVPAGDATTLDKDLEAPPSRDQCDERRQRLFLFILLAGVLVIIAIVVLVSVLTCPKEPTFTGFSNQWQDICAHPEQLALWLSNITDQSFDCQCNTDDTMISCVSHEPSHYSLTQDTLRWRLTTGGIPLDYRRCTDCRAPSLVVGDDACTCVEVDYVDRDPGETCRYSVASGRIECQCALCRAGDGDVVGYLVTCPDPQDSITSCTIDDILSTVLRKNVTADGVVQQNVTVYAASP